MVNICHMFKQLVVHLSMTESANISKTEASLVKCYKYMPSNTLGVIILDKTEEAVVCVKITETTSISIMFKKNSVGYATASLSSCYESIKELLKYDFYFYDIQTMKLLPFTEKLIKYDSVTQQHVTKIGIARILRNPNSSVKLNREVILTLTNFNIAFINQNGSTVGSCKTSTIIAADVTTPVADILKNLTTYIKTDIKQTQSYIIKVNSPSSTLTIESLIAKRSDLTKAECVDMMDLLGLTVTDGSGYSNTAYMSAMSQAVSHSLCVKGSFLQTVLPLESMSPGVQLSTYLPQAAPSLLLIRFPQLIHEFDMNLIYKPLSGIFQHTEKPDTRYRLLSIITNLSGYYEVLSNHSGYDKIDQSCKLMSNIAGEMTVSLDSIKPRVEYILYQLIAPMDD